MKKYLFLASITLTLNAYENMPEYLKDSTVTVTLKNGKEYKFDGNGWKVVSRTKSDQLTLEGLKRGAAFANGYSLGREHAESSEPSKNTLILQAGVGRTGVKDYKEGSAHVMEETSGPVLGLTYCRDLKYKLAPCATAITNETFMMGLKYGF
jgi:hypothetical protein